ncbi:hypothetical protein J6590_024227 [Homalodisca vitripennis]|nr:hypothetical protein J6590_024227 [Homalodisca vitripennis]
MEVGEAFSTYTNVEQKEEKKGKDRVITYPKDAWSLVQALSLRIMQIPSTSPDHENTITHHTVIASRLYLVVVVVVGMRKGGGMLLKELGGFIQ